jgi:cellulose synthase/poly-beta-1,6-N-acetylglucosamine synthase-like glycosyltransferase
MDWLVIAYLIYAFVALYFMSLYTLLFIPNRKKIFFFPRAEREYSLSMVVPCYNQEKNISQTIESLINCGYKGLKKIIVVDDCSTDNSFRVIKEFEKKYPSLVRVVQTPKNTGRASGSKNYGAKFVDTEIIGFTDADSFPQRGAIEKMMGFFKHKKTGGITSLVLVKNPKTLMEKLQAIEYRVIAFTRKLLGFLDAIYVTPGPLALYRKSVFDEIGGFDESNLTEDIEITWNLIKHGYRIEMSILSRVYTVAPNKFKDWFKQRVRWNHGGLQTMKKYQTQFLKKGTLGGFVLPFFVFSWILGLAGLAIIVYRTIRTIVLRLLSTTYSLQSQATILSLRDINLVPGVLIFYGIILLIFGILLIVISIKNTREKGFKKFGLIDMTMYMFVYLLSYPIILIISIYMLIRKKETW